ncbi:MAG: hypothetical protein ABI889_04070 [Gemmatimonadota bacterium]
MVDVLSVVRRVLSARCVSRVDGIPIRTLSIGDTFKLLRGTRTVSVGVVELLVLDESVCIPDMPDESLVMLLAGGVVVVVVLLDAPAVLSDCVLCVGVGAAAPVPYCFDDESVMFVVLEDESVMFVVLVEGDAVELLDDMDEESVVVEDDGVPDIDEESVVVEDDGVLDIDEESLMLEDEDVPDIDEESVVLDDDGVVVIDEEGVVVTSPVDVECEPSFDTRMWLLVWPSTTAGERAIAAIAMSLMFMCSP